MVSRVNIDRHGVECILSCNPSPLCFEYQVIINLSLLIMCHHKKVHDCLPKKYTNRQKNGNWLQIAPPVFLVYSYVRPKECACTKEIGIGHHLQDTQHTHYILDIKHNPWHHLCMTCGLPGVSRPEMMRVASEPFDKVALHTSPRLDMVQKR